MSLGFQHPWVLVFLLLPLAGMFFSTISGGHPIAIPFDHARIKRGHLRHFWLTLAGYCPYLVLACAILILAGPMRMNIPSQKREAKNILLCLDVSGSMYHSGDGVRKYDIAVNSINNFCEMRKGDSFGLTVFGGDFWHWIPVTYDVDAISQSLSFLDPKNLTSVMSNTAIGKAVRGCHQNLARQKEGDRMLIVVTDGASQDLQNNAAVQIGQELKASRIPVYGIFISQNHAVPPDFASLCLASGGHCFSANDARALNTVFQKIDSAEPAQFKTIAAHNEPFYKPFCLAALATLALSCIHLFWLRYTPW